ncbi:MAG: tryptophan-rich sensory protein [Acidaminococcaceae bacterium]
MINKKDISIPIELLTAASFFLMIITNILANLLPINGLTTGQVSNFYPNLFTPAAFAFSIWGLIYMLLAGYVFYQLSLFKVKKNVAEEAFSDKIRHAFIISSFANSLWIVAWHYLQIMLSMLFITVMFICLGYIFFTLNKYNFSFDKRIFVKIPFSIYFAWVTVALIANFVVVAVSRQWEFFVAAESNWTILLLLLGLGFASFVIYTYKDAAYCTVIIWAYSGILIKHISADGFNSRYPLIIDTVIGSLVLLSLLFFYILKTKRKIDSD